MVFALRSRVNRISPVRFPDQRAGGPDVTSSKSKRLGGRLNYCQRAAVPCADGPEDGPLRRTVEIRAAWACHFTRPTFGHHRLERSQPISPPLPRTGFLRLGILTARGSPVGSWAAVGGSEIFRGHNLGWTKPGRTIPARRQPASDGIFRTLIESATVFGGPGSDWRGRFRSVSPAPPYRFSMDA